MIIEQSLCLKVSYLCYEKNSTLVLTSCNNRQLLLQFTVLFDSLILVQFQYEILTNNGKVKITMHTL